MAALFEELKANCRDDWAAYTNHSFVRALAAGTLEIEAFRFYLAQDYLFLKHFARAYALAVYKSETLSDMRAAVATLDGLLNHEMLLHVDLAAGWGIDAKALEATVEHPANMAYTRFVLERGLAGDLLDLLVALAPCVVGYGEIGSRLLADSSATLAANPYRSWIETYGGVEYQEIAAAAAAQIERVASDRLGDRPTANLRWATIQETFAAATRLEVGFWQMGLDAAAR
ncbi:thiaminase II [Limibacillus halophilus]|uniref:Aminopyrimidine aminohydrolase n=1 Tax=Limibacillus halophilus TaxID=1579333 RepID=A0A839SRT5_9PROT|nr:thiaminase II [Limibacillus halophilus]MBB3065018.1 thiaminase/transcriptional activator TenA [Limibacillus halophilus]